MPSSFRNTTSIKCLILPIRKVWFSFFFNKLLYHYSLFIGILPVTGSFNAQYSGLSVSKNAEIWQQCKCMHKWASNKKGNLVFMQFNNPLLCYHVVQPFHPAILHLFGISFSLPQYVICCGLQIHLLRTCKNLFFQKNKGGRRGRAEDMSTV